MTHFHGGEGFAVVRFDEVCSMIRVAKIQEGYGAVGHGIPLVIISKSECSIRKGSPDDPQMRNAFLRRSYECQEIRRCHPSWYSQYSQDDIRCACLFRNFSIFRCRRSISEYMNYALWKVR